MALFADYEPRRPGTPRPSGLARFEVRPATDDDVPAIARIRAQRDEITEDVAASVFRRTLSRAPEGRAALLVAAIGDGHDSLVGYGVAERLALEGIPEGWYLGGVVVAPSHRRLGIGARLTRERLAWISGRAREAYYFVNERNRASIDLHSAFGFVEVARDIRVAGITFSNGIGLLFRVSLPIAEIER